MHRRDWLLRGAAGLAAAGAAPGAVAERRSDAVASRTLRTTLAAAEAGFDPLAVSDAYSIAVLAHIFEAPLGWDPLAEPARLVPRTAASLPEVSDDFRHFVFTLRPGVFFADDPVLGGRPRELTAADHVYSLKRFYDPALRTEHLYHFENAGLLGLSELRRRALRERTAFPYDVDVPGLRALDRYRFELRTATPQPRLPYLFADVNLAGALAREVVERHGADIAAHPVGTGPFRLVQWRRGSRIVLERNPRFRDERWSATPAEDDAEGQATLRALRGRRLPMLERVEIDVVEEAQPRWLSFLDGTHDVLTPVPTTFAPLALPGGALAPFLARRGIRLHRRLAPSLTHSFFNMDDPLVGGYTPQKVALRRAVALACDRARDVRLVRGGQAEPARALIPPGCYGHDPALRSEWTQADPARARALLDTWGYLDRDGDGVRETPEGQPLVLRMASGSTQVDRLRQELWRKETAAVGLRMEFEVGPFAQLISRALAGRLMMWGFNWQAGNPDGDFFLGLAYGPNAEQSNDARFRLPAYDRLYEAQRALPDGPARLAAMQRATRMLLAYVPYIAHVHPVLSDLTQPHVLGHRRHPFARDEWRYTALLDA